ncbi:LmeA family phospholipid-binding protein [Nocardia sp. NPDC088792]|uniref:LmeA family phospholipid-binding protein n=1 Tax=Nocardia sp. NPDC088792 TaxID=3364332 RepID=UPI0037FCE825
MAKPPSEDAINRAAGIDGTEDSGTEPTEILSPGAPAGTPEQAAEWWHESTTQLPGQGPAGDDGSTAVIPSGTGEGAQPTEILHPGEAAYAPGAVPPPQATARSGAGNTAGFGPQGTGVLDPAAAAPSTVTGSSQLPPGTPPPPANPAGGQGGPSGMRRKRRTLLIVAIVAVLLVVGGLAGGEAYARHKVENCISSQFEQQMGSKIDVSFGWKPLLLTMFDGKVSSVTVNSDDTKFGPAQGMVVHATFDDVDVKDNGNQGATIGSSTADVTWSNDGIVKTLGGLVTNGTSDPGSGTLSFGVLGGIAQLQVKPKIVGDKIEVDTESASLLGFGLPTDLVSGIVDLMTQSLQSYPMGLVPTGVQVTGDGLHVTLKGGRTTLQPVNGQTPTSC